MADGLSPDIMNNVLEGTLHPSLKQVLYLTEGKKLFSLDTLNERMQLFNYGPMQTKNKPVPVKAATLTSPDACKLKQSGMSLLRVCSLLPTHMLYSSASQAWCLGRFFHLLVGGLVPEGDEKWENYLHLLTIVDYIFAFVTTAD